MKLSKPNIPKELDADVAMSVIIPHTNSISEKELSYNYEFKGVSERTALGDDLSIAIRNRQNAASSIKFSLKRDSLYHILPEYLFHPLDHYLGADGDIDLTLGEISLDMSWGDPVKNPQIRCNKASNLYGPVRHNANGSIRWHRGFDYYAPKGTTVYSVGNGIVSLIQNHPDYGLCVLITHKRPQKTYYSFYAHLSSVTVKYGDKVQKGKAIGKSGTTGNANNLTGEEEHLHFEYRTSPKHGDRKQENPNAILKTKFYSADPKNKWQSNVGVVKKGGQSLFE